MIVRKLLLFVCLVLPVVLAAQTKKTPVSSKSKQVIKVVDSKVMDRGRVVYTAYCMSCHQLDGSGVGDLNPPLIKNKWVLGPKTVLVQQILKGSIGKVEIDGETFRNSMPAQPFLTDMQIADVLTYIRKSFGNRASSVTSAEVKSIRAKTK